MYLLEDSHYHLYVQTYRYGYPQQYRSLEVHQFRDSKYNFHRLAL